LSTGGYSWLLEEVKRWKQIGGDELTSRELFLKRIDKDVKEVTKLQPNDNETAPGPTLYFSNTIWAAALDGVFDQLLYSVANPEGGLYQVRYGAFLIALAKTKDEAEQYRKWHTDLMTESKKSTQVENTAKLKKERDLVTKAIQQGLTKLIVAGRVLGACEGCP
jgi:hypothetical protein